MTNYIYFLIGGTVGMIFMCLIQAKRCAGYEKEE
jgi:hypothetical protein